jgi:ferric iron reductase protein FhuF
VPWSASRLRWADIDSVSGADTVAAIHRAGRDNPLLGIGTGTGSGDSLPSSDLCPGPASRLVDAVGAWAGASERRVAGSLVVLGYSARLVGPTIATMVGDQILLDVRPHKVRYSFQPGFGFALTLPDPTGWRATPEALRQRWCHDVIDGHLRALIDAVRVTAPAAAGLLWGNVASGVAGALHSVAQAGTVPVGDCHALGSALLAHGPLSGSGTLNIHNGQLQFTRRSCCLIYRLDGGGMCGDCALL